MGQEYEHEYKCYVHYKKPNGSREIALVDSKEGRAINAQLESNVKKKIKSDSGYYSAKSMTKAVVGLSEQIALGKVPIKNGLQSKLQK